MAQDVQVLTWTCWEYNPLHAQHTGALVLTPHGGSAHLQTDSCARSSGGQKLAEQLVPVAPYLQQPQRCSGDALQEMPVRHSRGSGLEL